MAKAGRKEKYKEVIEPVLSDINSAIMRGCTEEQIAASVGISIATLQNYKKKYPELAEALTNRKGAIALQQLVNAGIQAACGMMVEEETMTVALDENNLPTKKQKITSKRYIPANATLNLFYVKHFGKNEGFTSDPLDLDLRRDKFEFDKAVQSLKDWNDYSNTDPKKNK